MTPPTIEDHRRLCAAQGYASLGMYLEANEELAEMSRPCRELREVLEVKHEIFRSLGNWDLVEVTALKLSELSHEYSRRPAVSAERPGSVRGSLQGLSSGHDRSQNPAVTPAARR